MLNTLFESLNEDESTCANNFNEIQGDLNKLLLKLNEMKDLEPVEQQMATTEYFISNLETISKKMSRPTVDVAPILADERIELPTKAENEVENELFVKDLENSLQQLATMANQAIADLPQNNGVSESRDELRSSANHLKQIFEDSLDKSLFLTDNFECQCDIASDDAAKTFTDLMETNKNLFVQLEAKIDEIKQLNSYVTSLQESDAKNRAEISELKSELDSVKKCQSPPPPLAQEAAMTSVSASTIENDYETDINYDCHEIHSLEDLIGNYLKLIKSYKKILARLDEVKIDHSQLKVSYNYLNSRYLKLRNSTSENELTDEATMTAEQNGELHQEDDCFGDNTTTTKISKTVNEKQIQLDNQNYASLVENKYKQQLENVKLAYSHLYELNARYRVDSHLSYNKLHDAYLKLLKNGNKPDTNDNL